MKCVLLALSLTGLSFNAQALGRLADVQIMDRETGAILTAHRHGGDYWVAGRPGGRYSISVRNQRGERLLAVTSVDGINVISGDTGAWNQSGYVFGPGESYEIAGWRKSDQEIAAFEFTAAPQSYAERTGRPANVGVIGVALFLERPQPRLPPPDYAGGSDDSSTLDARRAAVPPADAPSMKAEAAQGSLTGRSREMKLGTGHGERETSVVQSTQFERISETPDEIVRIRYDSFDNLVAMGIVRSDRHHPLQPVPNPFPDSAVSHYVPDPPAGG